MSWPQWSVGATSTLPGVINPAPSVTNPTQSAAPPNVLPTQYTQEQWAQLQQQNWQQWAQWQQQYQQWHQQYGAEVSAEDSHKRYLSARVGISQISTWRPWMYYREPLVDPKGNGTN